ncbi:monovalent cation/H(+) antiporter subunit G [Tessaracoccus oleiagri]|uniref:Multicomponent Na+:H+ antiporter subunit G n=1 Tax=Tessaracoccus oleiagri TaxID=686624 RepID=A0A1G9HSN0_9ACTN|nr:monovalent cation/H(+) antiporter subunit G [Tessaracoccus oleiagri]SDL15960.1 multicomponent Na+:H+ antiporter subunit G [Tessaracoccus oleiagri]
MTAVLDLVSALFVLVGAFMCFAAAVSLVRYPDVLGKLHAITKPQSLGVMAIAIGVALGVRTWWALSVAIITIVFQLLTSPVAANMVARGAYRSGIVPSRNLNVDHLAEDLDEADARPDRLTPPPGGNSEPSGDHTR